MNRRNFLAAFAASVRSLGALAQQPTGRSKIVEVRLLRLRMVRDAGTLEPAWDKGGAMRFTTGGGSVLEIRTDQGLTGIGPGIDPALLGAVQKQLVGRDPFDTEQHAARLRYYAAGASYRGGSCVDVALWDLIGKACSQPLYKLFGGANERVVPYASMIVLGTPEERSRQAQQLSEQGWKAIKLRLHHNSMREDLRTVELVRKAVGDRMTVMVDANQAQSSGNWQPGLLWDFRRALETARELEKLGVYWLEEPLARYDFARLAELNRQVAIPLAGGENNSGLHEFRQMCEQGVYDILQPEPLVMEGITGLRKVGSLAEAHGLRIVPHHGGGDIGTIATLHLVASWPHAPYWELLHDPPVGSYENRFAIFQNPPRVGKDGLIDPPQGGGLGVSIIDDLISRSEA
ncbi:MAG TPA: mandelate racemase/muconate lactonizing enzyme family protein [Bryobacteraceae bacterium]|nr:mandelate racemase/muconate lactonizing enzyme family protein [Bryobacteraceae bacterium]